MGEGDGADGDEPVIVASLIIAGVAALAALLAAYFASRTVLESAAAQRQAERDRRRQRIEAVGDMAEEIFWKFDPELLARNDRAWHEMRNRLSRMMAGLEDELPECAKIREATSGVNARNSWHRQEVLNALDHLNEEDAADVVPKWPWQKAPGIQVSPAWD